MLYEREFLFVSLVRQLFEMESAQAERREFATGSNFFHLRVDPTPRKIRGKKYAAASSETIPFTLMLFNTLKEIISQTGCLQTRMFLKIK